MMMSEYERPLLEIERSHLTRITSNRKGGFRTLPFIIANGALEKVASLGMMPNMILYLVHDYRLDMVSSTNILNLYSSAGNFTPLLGAILADSLVGRFWTIGIGSIITLLGMIILWSTTIFQEARPPPCINSSTSCSSSTTLQLAVLCTSFALMAIGAGGIRGPSLAFGKDQITDIRRNGTNDNEGIMARYFGLYYAATGISSLIGLTCFAYFQEHFGWKIGFGIPVAFMFLSALSFFIASSFYVILTAKASLLLGAVQVIVASFKNRHLSEPSKRDDDLSYHTNGSTPVVPTEKLRFLNKACVITTPNQELDSNRQANNPWRLCTVDQVEELKALVCIIPMWSTGILFSLNSSQGPFLTIIVKSMDRHVTSSFEIPAGSFGLFTILSAMLWIVLYEVVIKHRASIIMGSQGHFSAKQRIGFGIFLSWLSMAYLGVIESIRRGIAIEEGFADHPEAIANISALWIIPHNVLAGFADAVIMIAQFEFYMSWFPESMSSIASNISGIAGCVACLLASFIVSTVDQVTTRGGKVSWISNNINKGHYDYYFWLLTGLSFINLLFFLFLCWVSLYRKVTMVRDR